MSKENLENEEVLTESEECTCEECVENDEVNQKIEEYVNIAKRVQADFDNYRKRSYDAMQNIRFETIVSVVEKFLPSLDSIDKAKTMITDDVVLEGINMIEKQMKTALYNMEIEEIPAKGEQFNPKCHNVIAIVNDNSLEDGIVTEVTQAGYKLKDRIVRYSQVVVNKKNKK